MRSTTNPIVAMVLCVFLGLVGWSMRGQPGQNASFMGLAFLVVAAAGFVGNLLVWLGSRR